MMRPTFLSIQDGSLADVAAAFTATGEKLSSAVANVLELLNAAGYAGAQGDTGDDLRIALSSHMHLVAELNAKASADSQSETTPRVSTSATTLRARQVDDTHNAPDMIALAAAHRNLKVTMSLNQALDNPAIKVVLRAVATKARKRQPRTDFRKLAANDLD